MSARTPNGSYPIPSRRLYFVCEYRPLVRARTQRFAHSFCMRKPAQRFYGCLSCFAISPGLNNFVSARDGFSGTTCHLTPGGGSHARSFSSITLRWRGLTSPDLASPDLTSSDLTSSDLTSSDLGTCMPLRSQLDWHQCR